MCVSSRRWTVQVSDQRERFAIYARTWLCRITWATTRSNGFCFSKRTLHDKHVLQCVLLTNCFAHKKKLNMHCRLHVLFTSPTMFQVCCTTWMSSLNRAELEKHLTLANAKGSMLFQTPEAEPARVFLHAILNGKALPAMCTFRQPPSSYVRSDHCATTDATSAFVSAPTTTTDDIKIAAAAAAAAASLGVDRATVDFQALPMSHRTLQTAPDAVELLSSALSRIDPLSFQQSEQNDGEPVVAAASVASNLDITPLRSTSNELSLDHRLKKAYERAPIKRDLLTFVQFSSVTIEATDHTQAIPSVVICNHSQVETQEQTTFDLLSAHRNNTGDMIATTKDSSLLRRKKQRVSDESANMQHKLPLPQLQPIVSSEDSVTLSQLMMDPLLLLGTVALADEIYGNSESNAGAEINNNVSVHQSAAAAASVCSTTSTMAHEPNLTFSPVNKEIELKRTEQLEIQTLTTPITATSTSSVTSCPYSYRPYTSYPDHLHSVTLNGWYLPITYGYSLMGCVPTVPWFMRSHH